MEFCEAINGPGGSLGDIRGVSGKKTLAHIRNCPRRDLGERSLVFICCFVVFILCPCPFPPPFFFTKSICDLYDEENTSVGAPGWLSGLSVCLWLEPSSQGPGIEPHGGLPAQRGACFSLSLCPTLSLVHAHTLSLSQINKIK